MITLKKMIKDNELQYTVYNLWVTPMNVIGYTDESYMTGLSFYHQKNISSFYHQNSIILPQKSKFYIPRKIKSNKKRLQLIEKKKND